MTTDQKLIAFAISALLIAVLSIIAYNFYNSSIQVAAYRECVEANKVIADMMAHSNSGAFRVMGIPNCR